MAVQFNPWNVSSLEEFLFNNCPQCDSKYSTREQFAGHAIVSHERAGEFLPKILHKKPEASNVRELIEETNPEGFDENENDVFELVIVWKYLDGELTGIYYSDENEDGEDDFVSFDFDLDGKIDETIEAENKVTPI